MSIKFFWLAYVTADHRVGVKVLDLLPHHFVVSNLLRMASFLPNLILPLFLGPQLESPELL